MRTFVSLLLIIAVNHVHAQPTTKDSIPHYWNLKSTFSLNGTQTSFVNWNAGGRNNISVLASVNSLATFAKNKSKWDNTIALALGGLKYVGAGAGEESLQKTDDRIELDTKYGYKLRDKLFTSVFGNFKTQFLDGFSYPDDSTAISTFLAPGYLSTGFGIDYAPNSWMTMFLSPISTKFTIVRDQTLANAGEFGVEPATYNPTTGELLTLGERFRTEVGAYYKFQMNKEIVKNIHLTASLGLFSNYLNHPENIDVNADVLFNFKVNAWFSASLNCSLIYDDDITIRDAGGNFGPRTQFKSVIGLGISYTVMNFEEPKKEAK